MRLNPRVPKWEAVAEDLRDRVQSGDIPAGSEFPSLPTIKQYYGVSTGTARHAQKLLAKEGVIISRGHGLAYFVPDGE